MNDSDGSRGVTLIELIIALVLSALVIAALYKTFILQQKTYTVQEQVVDMQQNAKAVVVRMVREIRMAGFGRVAGEYVPGRGYVSRILPVQFQGRNGETIVYRNVMNRNTPAQGLLTMIMAINSMEKSASLIGVASRYQMIVDKVKYDRDQDLFDLANKRYISIDGVESNVITGIAEETIGNSTLYRVTLQHPLQYNYAPGTRIFPITAVTLDVGGREEVGASKQPMAENIESVSFEYLDDQGNPTINDDDIRMVRLMVTARTGRSDPTFKEREGFRRRELSTHIQMRNLTFVP